MDLKETRKLVERLEGRIEDLVEHGFEKMTPPSDSSFSGKQFYVNRKEGVVVKRPFTCEKTIVPKFAIETIVLNYPQQDSDKIALSLICHEGNYDAVHIQPLADVDSASQHEAKQQLSKLGYEGDDFRKDNCAMYKGQPVAIDW